MANKNTTILGAAAIIVLALIVLGIAFGGGFFSGKPPAAAEKKYDTIRLPNTVITEAYIAEEKGFFEEEKIKIEWTGRQAGMGPGGVVSVVAGQNDAAGSISTAMIKSIAEGSNLQIVAAMGNKVSKEAQWVHYLVSENSTIKTPQDFIGKKVVANPLQITWYPLVIYLKRNGVDYNKVEYVQLPSQLAQEEAITSGQVDALASIITSPPASKLLEQGGYKLFPDVSFWNVLELSQPATFVMRKDYVEKNPDVVRRFVSALNKADKWASEHPQEALDITNRRDEVPEQNWKYTKPGLWSENAVVDKESIQKWIDLLVEFGQLKEGQIKAEDVYTNDYNPLYKK